MKHRIGLVLTSVLVFGCGTSSPTAPTAPTAPTVPSPPAKKRVERPPPMVDAMLVNGQGVARTSWAFYVTSYSKRWVPSIIVDRRKYQTQHWQPVLDLLLRRELLAQAAEAAGVKLTNKDVKGKLTEGGIYVLGARRDGKRWYFRQRANGIVFDAETLLGLGSMLGLNSLGDIVREQHREQLAQMMVKRISDTVRVSDAKVKNEFVYDNTTASLDFVVFNPIRYGRTKFRKKSAGGNEWHAHAWLSRVELDHYLKSHEAAVKKRYAADAQIWYAKKNRVLARYLFINKGTGQSNDPNRAKAESLQRQLAAGGDFATLARRHSDDICSNYRDGLLYWREVDHLGKGLEVSRAAKKLKVNEVSKVIEDSRGYHIVRVESRTNKKLSYAQVKYQVAEVLAKDFYRTQRALADANKAQIVARAGRKLAGLFKRGVAQRLGHVRLTPELFRRLQAMPRVQREMLLTNPALLRMMMGKAAGAKLARPTPPAVKLVRPFVPAVAKNLPPLRLRIAPTVQEYGAFKRRAAYGGPVSTNELTEMFDTLRAGQLAKRLYKSNNGYVVVQVTKRFKPDMKLFVGQAADIRGVLEAKKKSRAVDTWVAKHCRAAVKANKVRVNPELLLSLGSDKKTPVAYTPCKALSGGGD